MATTLRDFEMSDRRTWLEKAKADINKNSPKNRERKTSKIDRLNLIFLRKDAKRSKKSPGS
jgi:hypothetical protein